MVGLGILFIVFGIGSAVLPLFNIQFRLMSWIDDLGTGPAWGIRAGFMVVGLLLLVVGLRSRSASQ